MIKLSSTTIIKLMLIGFLLFIISKVIYDHFTIFESTISHNKEVSKKLITSKQNEFVANSIELNLIRSNGNYLDLSELESPCLVLYLNEYMCTACINNELDNIEQFLDESKGCNLCIIYNTSNNLQVKKIKQNLKVQVLQIKQATDCVKINVPFYFYYDECISNVFITDKLDNTRTNAYLSIYNS